ncbi:GNAT family N-acetyltransferase [Microbacterium sp. P01]|uniref:GNAT family N-acetyltransferase n=1 Tax=Microbacterium sp. P01 TaxID=3366261 RepID=UPI00366BA09F
MSRTPPTLTVRPLVVPRSGDDPRRGDMDELVRLGNAVNRHDAGHPFFDQTVKEVLPGWQDQTDHTRLGFIVEHDRSVAGIATLVLPNEPGASTLEFELMVEPALRGEDVWNTLLDVVEKAAREHQRSVIQTWTLHRRDAVGETLTPPTGYGAIPSDDPHALFLSAHGFAFEQVERNSTLDLHGDLTSVADALQEAIAFAGPDYRLLTWAAPTPPEYADGFAYTLSRMATDVPSGGMVWEEETWDAARVARRDGRLLAAGNTMSVAAVSHAPTGRIVAFNELMIGADHSGTTHQWGTLVVKEHRGHRLGTIVKCANLLRWHDLVPESPRVSTFNAEENRPMLDINEAIGFVPASYAGAWKKVLS